MSKESENVLEGRVTDSTNVHCDSQKSKTPFNSVSGSVRSSETIDQRKIPGPNFNVNHPSMNGPRLVENRPPCRTTQSNRKLEKDSDLVGMLGKQLYIVECRMQRMQIAMSKADDRLKDKDKQICRLKRKVREWEARFKDERIVQKKELQKERNQVEDSSVYRRCLMLEHKIDEMEKFLADYGLVWIGESDKSHDSVETKPCNDYLKNCYTQLVANIEELNVAAGEGEVHVQKDKGGGGASFKTAPCMSLKFFKNGLVVQNGNLRPYDDPTVEFFIHDILDGYFPSELQQVYPHGVPFKVEDHRTEAFQGPGSGFPGHGYRLDKSIRKDSAESSRCSVSQRQNFHSPKKTVPLSMSTIAKSVKSQSFSDSPTSDMTQLRSQILASHNNNCSDSHIQSHINAELGLSSSLRDKRRECAIKEGRYQIPVREHTLKLDGDKRPGSQRLMSGSRTSYHSSTERSSNQMFSGSSLDRSRSRSSSLPGRRLRLRSLSKTRDSSGTDSSTAPKTFDYNRLNTGVKRPRATKSATLEQRTALAPLLHKINDPTGRPGELRLKVRSLNGSVVYLVHLCADDTVARLYQLLNTCMSKTRLRGYKVVISGYAPKRLEQLDLSLREYGISRDSVLHVINDSKI